MAAIATGSIDQVKATAAAIQAAQQAADQYLENLRRLSEEHGHE